MFRKLIKFLPLLDKKKKRDITISQILVTILAFLELVTIGSIVKFMQVVTDSTSLNEFKVSFDFISSYSDGDFIVILSLALVLLITVNSIFSVFIFRFFTKISISLGHSLSCQLFSKYLSQSWIFHSKNNSSYLINNMISETDRLAHGVINPLSVILSRLTLVIFISVAIFIYNPVATSLILLFFSIGYFLISWLVKARLLSNGVEISRCNRGRLQVATEAFDNIKLLLIDGKKNYFSSKYKQLSCASSEASISTLVLSQSPRYMMEWLAFVSMILVVLGTVVVQGNSNGLIPLLTIYGLAALRLLPSLQQIYIALSTMKGNLSALDVITSEMKKKEQLSLVNNNSNTLKFQNALRIEGGFFSYSDDRPPTINGVNMTIEKNKIVGIVGESGSGKSTLIDILTGLIELDSGYMTVDSQTLEGRISSWRDKVAYVPQHIALSDASIAENIAFGECVEDIDFDLVNKVIKQASMDVFVDGLEDGLNTNVGEKGVLLSGGQRQRLGIARALYKNADVLVLDEATSALDGITENEIMNSIRRLSEKLTIIIVAHRLKTVQNCDYIYVVKGGEINGVDTFDGLLKSNSHFKRMSNYA